MPEQPIISVLIVDDEAPARRGLRRLLSREPNTVLVGECDSGSEALIAIEKLKPALVFLDIQMPEFDGFEVLKKLDRRAMPEIVFVTAYDTHALAAFEAAAIDYLTKPLDERRFRIALERARQRVHEKRSASHLTSLFEALNRAPKHVDHFSVRTGDRIELVSTDTIEWISAEGDYSCLHSSLREQLIRETLTALEAQLDPKQFLRVHRSRILNLNKIRDVRRMIHGEFVFTLQGGQKISSGRGYVPQIKAFFANRKLSRSSP
jgi:two-component system LytT family response regulator